MVGLPSPQLNSKVNSAAWSTGEGSSTLVTDSAMGLAFVHAAGATRLALGATLRIVTLSS